MVATGAYQAVLDIQQRIAGDVLRRKTDEAGALLADKERIANFLNALSDCKGRELWPEKITELKDRAKACGINPDELFGPNNDKFDVKDGKIYMWNADADKKNVGAYDDIMKRVQRDLDRVGERLQACQSKMDVSKSEAEDAEARLKKLESGDISFRKELRSM